MGSTKNDTSSEAVPPLVHAIGGSVGSALSLLILYPLERVRIELQSQASAEEEEEASFEEEVTFLHPFEDSSPFIPTTTEDLSPEISNSSKGGISFELLSLGNSRSTTATPSLSLLPHVDPTNYCDTQVVSPHSDDNDGNSSPSWSMSSRDEESRNAIHPDTTADIARLDASAAHNSRSKERGVWNCLCRLHREGELYRGVTPVVTTLGISNFVFFFAHAWVKRRLGRNNKQSMTRSLVASSLAGIINVLLTNPLWVANLRIVANKNMECSAGQDNNLFRLVWKIMKNEGVGQLWSGTWASLLLVSNPAIQHMAYERLKCHRLAPSRQPSSTLLQRRVSNGVGNNKLSPLEAFLLGAMAKAVSTIVTYPLQLAQVLLRLQKQEKEAPSTQKKDSSLLLYTGTWNCLVRLCREGGIQGMYRGMNAKLLQTVLTAAFTFLTYEQILGQVQSTYLSLRTTSPGSHRTSLLQ
mmetsp:Transcript_29377/g.53811  ORF Transcript_29377/g.53811 Transcript_29377/m.53811 type:complete len:468 (-) Transcript_29377:94-1497(-)